MEYKCNSSKDKLGMLILDVKGNYFKKEKKYAVNCKREKDLIILDLSDNIKFNIIYTNEQNDTADYNEPTFFTDCSNPITLEYLNNNLVTNYKMDENKQVSFDGSILEDVGISTDSINCKVKFKINIINNQNEKYSCPINFQIPLDDIYEGTTMKAKTTNSSKYIFFRE